MNKVLSTLKSIESENWINLHRNSDCIHIPADS